jgi:hypothetical protein
MLIIGSTFELRETPKNLWSLDFTMGRCSATVAKYKVWLYPNSQYTAVCLVIEDLNVVLKDPFKGL